jgi:GSH-dependent disulfide-bond oxidoreductase
MIDLYFYDTPNGYKITIFLEETGLPYRIIALDLTRGEHLTPEYTKINPNNQMPAIIDRNGPGGKPYKVFESGAILLYLAEKSGQLMPTETGSRYEVIQWLMLQMGRIGPFFGQAVAFRRMEEQIPFAVDKFTKEARRLFGVLDRRLGEVPYLAGEYSIADIATFPWTRVHERQGIELEEFPNVKRWYDAIDSRPAVRRGLAVTVKRKAQDA